MVTAPRGPSILDLIVWYLDDGMKSRPRIHIKIVAWLKWPYFHLNNRQFTNRHILSSPVFWWLLCPSIRYFNIVNLMILSGEVNLIPDILLPFWFHKIYHSSLVFAKYVCLCLNFSFSVLLLNSKILSILKQWWNFFFFVINWIL